MKFLHSPLLRQKLRGNKIGSVIGESLGACPTRDSRIHQTRCSTSCPLQPAITARTSSCCLARSPSTSCSALPGLARLVPERLRVFYAITLFFDSRLNRKGRSEANLLVRGAVVTAIMVLIAVAAGIALDRYARMIPYGWVVEFAVLVVCLSSRRMFLDLRRGLQVLGTEDLAAGQDMVARWTGRDASRLDKFGVARILVELAAVAVGRRVVIPAFWFVLLGFPGLFVSRAVSRLAIAAAGRDAATRAFGAVAMRLDHVLGLLPSYLGAGLLSLAAVVVPRASVRRGFEVMSLDADARRNRKRRPLQGCRGGGARPCAGRAVRYQGRRRRARCVDRQRSRPRRPVAMSAACSISRRWRCCWSARRSRPVAERRLTALR